MNTITFEFCLVKIKPKNQPLISLAKYIIKQKRNIYTAWTIGN